MSSCAQNSSNTIVTAADQTPLYLKKLKGKKIAVVANQTSVIKNKKNGYTHLVDSLVNSNINIQKVFAPEHGFRGKADAGEEIKDGVDTKTGLPIISLYGKNKKPSKEQLKGINAVVFDIQDVGARFYTYISTLHYVMEACAESGIPVIVLDRPNPNGHYIDGPVLEPEHKSFVGMHPVPIVYGMTIGEYAKMINGEKWLANGIKAKLTVIPLKNYTHQSEYSLPIKPSPNLPNDVSINLYPSLCFFEGTNVSAGRGTDMQFQVYGSPFLNDKNPFSYTPSPNEGAKYPKHAYMICYGEDLRCKEPITIQNVLNHTVNGKPGTRFFYNPIMYSRLSRYVEYINGNPIQTAERGHNTLAQLIQEKILGPADMSWTMASQWQRDKPHVFFDMSQGYKYKEGRYSELLRP